jgi:hypothetical protein
MFDLACLVRMVFLERAFNELPHVPNKICTVN